MKSFFLALGLFGLLIFGGCSDNNKNKDQGVKDKGPPSEMMVFVDQGPPTEQGITKDGPPGDQNTVSDPLIGYFPKNSEIEDWQEDTSVGKPGVEVGRTKDEIEAIIDGMHDPYAAKNCKGFAKQDYKNSYEPTWKLTAYLWEMSDAGSSELLMTQAKQKDETENSVTFSAIQNLKDQAWIGDDKPNWKVHGFRDVFVLRIVSNYGEEAKASPNSFDAEKFVRFILGKVPGP